MQSKHIPQLKTITAFYDQLRIGLPQGNDFSIMRLEDQPESKRMEMPLFRCQFYRVVFFKNRGVEWSLPSSDAAVLSSENSIYFAYPGKLESWRSEHQMEGFLICFTEEFAQADRFLESTYPFFEFKARHLLHLSDKEAQLLVNQQEELLEEMNMQQADKPEMLRLLLHRYLLSIKRVYENRVVENSEAAQNDHQIFQDFLQYIDAHFARLAANEIDYAPSVSSIAQQLYLHPSYLNTLIKNLTGKTASSFLHDKTILEAKSYLIHTELQVAEIALQLGFNHTSYFNRFFKKMTDQTPSAFRKAYQ